MAIDISRWLRVWKERWKVMTKEIKIRNIPDDMFEQLRDISKNITIQALMSLCYRKFKIS